MKKTLTLIFVLILLFSLCACKKPASENPSANGTGETAGKQTENTELTGNLSTTPTASSSADETTPTTPSGTTATEPSGTSATEPPETTAPVPTTCSHNFSGATCTAPKTCAKCGATEGSAIGHNWKDATCSAPKTCSHCGATEGDRLAHTYSDGFCSVCGTEDPVLPFKGNKWLGYTIHGEHLIEMSIDATRTMQFYNTTYTPYKNSDALTNKQVTYNGKTYYLMNQGDWSRIDLKNLDNGNVRLVIHMGYDVTFELQREGETSFKVISSSMGLVVPENTVFRAVK